MISVVNRELKASGEVKFNLESLKKMRDGKDERINDLRDEVNKNKVEVMNEVKMTEDRLNEKINEINEEIKKLNEVLINHYEAIKTIGDKMGMIEENK